MAQQLLGFFEKTPESRLKQFKTGIAGYDLGSLPNGGKVLDTPIYFADENLLCEVNEGKRTLKDLSWGNYLAFVIDDILTPQECKEFIALTEQLGFTAAAPGINTPPGMRMNQTVHWLANSETAEQLFERIAEHLPQSIDGQNLIPAISQRFNTYRYTEGDEFRPHVDGDWPGYYFNPKTKLIENWTTGRSQLSMLLYLNGPQEGVEGGRTLLFDGLSVKHSVTPKSGSALFFRHGLHQESVLHAGEKVTGKVPKYVVRINIMYE